MGQIGFLVELQRLLDEGSFVASYKSALLLSLADLCVEHGADSGSPLELATDEIADRFIRYHWEQARPYPAPAEARILRQNTGNQAAIVNLVRAARAAHGDLLASLMRDRVAWRLLVRQVARIVGDPRAPLFGAHRNYKESAYKRQLNCAPNGRARCWRPENREQFVSSVDV
jgi:hypothetical protein